MRLPLRSVNDEAHDLLDAVVARLADGTGPPVRAMLWPGETASADVCGEDGDADGQAWVSLSRIFPAAPFPVEAPPQRCGVDEFAVTLHAGVLRCAATVDNYGAPPTEAQRTTDADRVHADAVSILDAIVIDYLDGEDGDLWRLDGWTPLGPQGGCVGGRWSLTLATRPPTGG